MVPIKLIPTETGGIPSLDGQIVVPTASMVDLFGDRWASNLTNWYSNYFTTDMHSKSRFISVCRVIERNNACLKANHMIKARDQGGPIIDVINGTNSRGS